MRPTLLAAAAALSLTALPAFAAVDSFEFNLPAVGLGAVNPPYPNVATLTLSDIAGGVQFTLTPNASSSGFEGDPNTEFVERLTLAFTGSAPITFANVSGAALQSVSFSANPALDAGYSSQAQAIAFDWYSTPANGGLRFDVTETSTWNVFGTGVNVASFSNTFATANNKPSPTHGVISVTGYDLEVQRPTPSNWVDSVSAVPEPEVYASMIAGVALLGALARRRRSGS
jgi:hypothetical protein